MRNLTGVTKGKLLSPFLLASALVWTFVYTVSANYTGPSPRSYQLTVERDVPAGSIAECNSAGRCGGIDCTVCTWVRNRTGCSGYPTGSCAQGASYYDYRSWTEHVEDKETRYHPKATSTGFLQCTQMGANNWCVGTLTAELRASEPYSPYLIENFEGSADRILCDPQDAPAIECSVELDEGLYTFEYWANSTYGDQTSFGMLDVRLDRTPPELHFELPPPDGQNGWYTHPFQADFRITDAISSPATSGIRAEGGEWLEEVEVSSDGVHLLEAQGTDQAGNRASSELSVGLDQTAPVLLYSVSEPDGQGGWYRAPLHSTVAGTDATSGVASATISLDGDEGHSDELLVEGEDGQHTLVFSVVDLAGNVTAEEVSIWLDRTPPALEIVQGVQEGELVKLDVELSGSVSDDTSGVASARLRIDNRDWQVLALDPQGTWAYRWDTRSEKGGSHTLTLEVNDVAGNTTSWHASPYVANALPALALTPRWKVWERGELTVTAGDLKVVRLGLRFAPSSLQGQGLSREETIELELLPGAIWSGAVSWDRTLLGGSGEVILMGPGEYDVDVVAVDEIGREVTTHAQILIPLPPPTPVPTRAAPPVATALEPASLPSVPAPALPLAPIPTTPVLASPAPALPLPAVPARSRPLWAYLLLMGLSVGLGASACADRRPRAWRELARQSHMLIQFTFGGKKNDP